MAPFVFPVTREMLATAYFRFRTLPSPPLPAYGALGTRTEGSALQDRIAWLPEYRSGQGAPARYAGPADRGGWAPRCPSAHTQAFGESESALSGKCLRSIAHFGEGCGRPCDIITLLVEPDWDTSQHDQSCRIGRNKQPSWREPPSRPSKNRLRRSEAEKR
jgi:hypothetical protein